MFQVRLGIVNIRADEFLRRFGSHGLQFGQKLAKGLGVLQGNEVKIKAVAGGINVEHVFANGRCLAQGHFQICQAPFGFVRLLS